MAAAAVVAAFAAEAKTFAIAEVGNRSEKDLVVFESAVREAGHEVRKISGFTRVMQTPEVYEGVDVVVLTGGWNDSNEPSIATCRQLVRFAARGGGVFLGAFRGGAVRTGGYAAFPEVARTYNRCNSPWLRGVGDSSLAKALGGNPVLFGGIDHIVLKVGERGAVFAKCGEDPVGAFGEFGLGRVVVLGAFLETAADDIYLGRKKALFRAMAEYLAGGDKSDSADAVADKAVADFDRRMFVDEWTHDERGDGRRLGIITGLRDNTVIPVEGKAMVLEFFARELKDRALAVQCGELAKRVRVVSGGIRDLAEKKIQDIVSSCSRGSSSLGLLENKKAAEEKVRAEFAALAAKSPDAEVDALIEKARIAIRAQRKADRAEEHKRDLASLPSLVPCLSSRDSEARLSAATELGRIGEATPEVVAALVAAFDDADDKVRVQSAISLGWMQAKDAVPALVAKARQNSDIPLKRRAIQALGQIGDDRAIPTVVEALDSTDRYSVENAILSLGWLKAKAAVPRLVEIALDDSKPVFLGGMDPKRLARRMDLHKVHSDMSVVNRRVSAVRALGHIGDKSAVPALEKVAADNTAYYSDVWAATCCLGISLCSAAKEAVAAINRGGLAEKGIRQPEALSSRAVFYGMRHRNNALAGRLESVVRKMDVFGDDREHLLIPYILDAGFTGIHGAWGERDFNSEAAFMKAVRDMDDFGLSFVGTAPAGGEVALSDIHRASMDRTFSMVGDCVSYAACWSEENWPFQKTPHLPPELCAFMPPEGEDPAVCEMGAAARAARVACLEEHGAKIESCWRETQDWLHARRKGFAFTFTLSHVVLNAPIGGPSSFSRIDVPGNECYESFGRFLAYFCSRIRNGETRPVMSEFYNWYSPSNEHVLRGCWLAAVHSKCHYPFALNQYAPFLCTYNSWSWEKGRWAQYEKVLRHVRANEELYAVSPSAAKVAVLMSERSTAAFKHRAVYRQAPMLELADEESLAVWTALSQSHVGADVVFIDGATEEKLAKYRVLFLTGAKILTAGEQALLREWVADGGTLVCSGTVSLFDAKNLTRRCNYAIADLLGVNYVKTEYKKSKEVFAQRPGLLHGKAIYPAEPGLDNFYRFGEHIWRDFKPTDCVVAATGGVEYDASLGIDKVELAGAKAVQAFADGSPALTKNDYGKGQVLFFASVCPSLGHVTSRWELKPNKFDFWPGVRETYEKIAREGLARAGTAPAVDLLNASKEVEVTVYVQDGGRRLVVHLLDYDVNNKAVEGASLRINGTRPVKSVYRVGADTPEKKSVLNIDSNRTVELGRFEAYDMIVVEFDDEFAIPRAEFYKYYRAITGKAVPQGLVRFAIDPKVSKSGKDAYSIVSGKDGTVALTGSNLRSVMYAVYDLLGRRGGCGWFWDGDVVPKKADIDLSGLDVYEESRFEYRGMRYFAHRGLTRFQAEHWGFDDWKREIDWCVKRRLNLFMLRIGQDDLFQKAFPDVCKYPDASKALPGMDGRAFDKRALFWPLQFRGELRKRVMDYAFARGMMSPEDFGTMTHWYSRTPKDFIDKVKPDFMPQASGLYGDPSGLVWDVRNPKWMDAYWKLTDASVREYGRPDLLHTIGLAERKMSPSAEENRRIKIEMTNALFDEARRRYPASRLLLAGWDLYYRMKTPEEAKAFLRHIPNDIVIWDYEADAYDRTNFTEWDVVGKRPYTFGIFMTYESGLDPRADYGLIAQRQRVVADDPMCVGYILWPESSHVDSMGLEYFARNSWRADKPDVGEIVKGYCSRRYPAAESEKMEALWLDTISVSTNMHDIWRGNYAQPVMNLWCDDKLANDPAVWPAPRPDADFARVPDILRALCAVDWDGCEFVRRDAMDMARVAADRLIVEAENRLMRLWFDWLGGKCGAEAVRAAADRLRRLAGIMPRLLALHTDYSLFDSLERLKAVHPVPNPDFGRVLLDNCANAYCASHQAEPAERLYVPAIDMMAMQMAQKAESGDRSPLRTEDVRKMRETAVSMPLAPMRQQRTAAAFREVLKDIEAALSKKVYNTDMTEEGGVVKDEK